MLGAVLVLGADFIVAKRLAWTPGGFALSFGRMLQDGIVKRYLNDHCPDAKLQLCAYKDQLPDDADVWFWGSKLFDSLGRFAGLGKEMEKIAIDSLIDYPSMQIETAAVATWRQLIDVHTGEGVLPTIWHTYGIIGRYAPQLARPMLAARQQQGEFHFTVINDVQYPVALLSMALLAAHLVGVTAQESWPPLWANSTELRQPSSSHCWPTRLCAARCPIRTTAMARAWFGSQFLWSCWR